MWAFRSVIIFKILLLTLGKDVGEKCVPNNFENNGICTVMQDCEPAVRALLNKQFNNFERCGFSGFEEVVCCPVTTTEFGSDDSNDTRKLTKRIAEQECDKIKASRIPELNLNIIGGEMASVGEFPYMVALGYDRGNGYAFDCGGSLIAHQYVLTAAHCIDTRDLITPSVVRAGVIEIGDGQFHDEWDVRVDTITPHPDYSSRTKYHDIALIKLQKPLPFSSSVNAICLETNEQDPRTPLTITGWGKISNNREARSNILLKANVSAVERGRCSPAYSNWRKLPTGIERGQICAGDPNGTADACQGDSGGPLMGDHGDGQYRLVGITSFGQGCGSPTPGVYTRVAAYLGWIESIVWPSH